MIDPARLGAFLDSDTLPRLQRIGLGQSNLTFLVEVDGRRMVLRRPPEGPLPPRAHDVLREHRLISALAASAVPVPRPLAVCHDPEVLGAPFYLMEAVDGDAIRFELPASLIGQERTIGPQTVDALAQLHAVDPAAVGLADLGRPNGYLARQLRRWPAQLEDARVRATDDLDWATAWLAAHRPSHEGRSAIVHGDYKLDNVLFSHAPPARLLAIVDWEMATLGDPLADLGWLLAFWREPGEEPLGIPILPRVTERGGFSTRADLIARYAGQVGHSVPDLGFYVVLALWKLSMLLEGHWARHIRGTAGHFDFDYLEEGGPKLWAYLRRTAQQA